MNCPGKGSSMLWGRGLMLLAFSYTWSVVPRKNYLMPESSHVLVEKFFQFEHICFFFSPGIRVVVSKWFQCQSSWTWYQDFLSSKAQPLMRGRLMGSGFLMPPKSAAFQAPHCSFLQFGLYQGHPNLSDIFQYLWILKKKESGPISFPSISPSFSWQLVDANKFKQDWCCPTSPPASKLLQELMDIWENALSNLLYQQSLSPRPYRNAFSPSPPPHTLTQLSSIESNVEKTVVLMKMHQIKI